MILFFKKSCISSVRSIFGKSGYKGKRFTRVLEGLRKRFRMTSASFVRTSIGLDYSPWIPISSVRSCARFGLSLPVFRISCPKLHQVQTLSLGFPTLLSEVTPSSDSLSRFSHSSVRSCTRFRLSLSVFPLSCPKLHQVRTLSLGFPTLLSEVTPGSDSLFRFSHSPVRSCVWFRLIPFNVSHFSAHQQAGAVHLTAE